MDHETKLKFILALHKHSLKAMDSGGIVNGVTGALTATSGYQAQAPTSASTIGGQQATLAGQLGTESAGGGPNPAQSQYLQNSEQIAQNAATTYAGNRAINPGLAARLAGTTAASTQGAAAAQAGTQQAQQQLSAQNEMLGLTGQEQQGLLGTEGINAQVAQGNAAMQNQTAGGILGGIGSALGLAEGGEVKPKKMAAGGTINVPAIAGVPQFASSVSDQPTSSIGKHVSQKSAPDPFSKVTPAGPAMAGGAGDSPMPTGPIMAAKGGKIHMDPSLLVQTPGMASLMDSGGKVKAGSKAQKAEIKGNSLKNDKIPTLLSEGEEVLPRAVMQSKDPVKAAAAFVRAEMAKKRVKGMHGLSLSGHTA